MKRRLWISLIGTVLIVIGGLIGNLATDNTPILGLDLQGGVSVILAPTEDAGTEALIGARDQIRETLERNGIAEPDVRVQGENLVVDLPGVKDQQQALDLVVVSGIVELRPVVAFTECTSSLGQPTVTSDAGETITVGEDGEVTGTIGGDDGADVPADEPATDEPVDDTSDGADESGASLSNGPIGFRSAPEPDDVSDTEAPIDDAPIDSVPADSVPADSVPADSVPADSVPVDSVPIDSIPVSEPLDPVTPAVPIPSPTGADLLPTNDGAALCVGPSQGSGEVFEKDSATATLNQGWGVAVGLRPEGETTWNALATQCFNALPSCPGSGSGSGQLAIVLDGVIQSAPQVNQPTFSESVAITGQFSESEARSLARVLNRGAFPVPVEAQEARTVSASAGGDSLRAAIIAGLIGVAFVLTFLVLYYRWLALVIISGLAVWALTVFSAASLVSGWTNYALSLAGITGIIVAVGVTVDSYVVFFERMKDEIRNGRTLRNAGPRSFSSTWRTIWSADLVSVIGALILFWLSVGSVRGFALYLGITTVCDLLVCYFFTRPAVLLIARSKFMSGKRAFGLEVATS